MQDIGTSFRCTEEDGKVHFTSLQYHIEDRHLVVEHTATKITRHQLHIAKAEYTLILSTATLHYGHTARIDDNIDATQILISSTSVDWKRPTRGPQMSYMKTVQHWTEAVGLAQNRLLRRLLGTRGAI